MEQQQAEVLCLYMYVFVTEFVFFFPLLQIRVCFSCTLGETPEGEPGQ